MWKTAVAAVLALAAGSAAAVWVSAEWRQTADSSPPEWTRLGNGLQFRVQRVKGAKDVAVVTVFGTGSDSDPEGKIGLAHLAEHLYVTSAAGSEAARTADEWAESYGKNCSATTHDTFTCMAGVVGRKRLERELTDVAARMSVLRIEQSDLDRERPRVIGQIAEFDEAMGLMSARRRARARILELPNGGHSGGLRMDVQSITIDDAREFARRCYCPANARIAVTGDVDPDDVAALVTRLFARLPAGEPSPAPPEVQPHPELLLIERPAPPGPDWETCRWVWIAYPRDRGGPESSAVMEALGVWGNPARSSAEARANGFFLVFPDERAVLVLWTGDERPIEEVTQKFETLVDDFVAHATGPLCAERFRDVMRQYDKGVKEMKKHGLELPARDPSSPLEVAFGLAVPNGPAAIIDTVEGLTNDDIRRSVAKWHVAERRVVADVGGWRLARARDPDAKPADLPDLSAISEVRVTLTWDEATQSMHRKVGDREYAKDDDLQKAIADAHDAWVKKGKPDAPVTIDADTRIPWAEITNVVNVIKRCNIDKIEFAMGAAPKKAPPK